MPTAPIALDWVSEGVTDDGVVERRFDVSVSERRVPGLLWLPEGHEGPRPVVLIGHGACAHKGADYVVALARRLVREHGFAAAAIDAAAHGERRPDPDASELQVMGDFLTEWMRDGSTDDMIADWQATLAGLRQLAEVGDGPIGYWGLSMGTIYGVPFAAREPRVQVAVFGLMGIGGPTRDRLATDAPQITCPLLVLQQWDDQLMPRQQVLDLFDTLGSLDKRLHVHPGDHTAVPHEEIEFSISFLARHLGAGRQ